jgi:hypothetical protein
MWREVIWLPAVVLLLVFQFVVWVNGWVSRLPVESREVYTWSVGLVSWSAVLLVLAIAAPKDWLAGISASCALVVLALAVSRGRLCRGSATAGASSVPLVMAGMCLGLWCAVWSLTDRPASP